MPRAWATTLMQNLNDHPQQWIRAFEAKYLGKESFTKADWDKLLGHCQACCDIPAAIFAAELSHIYPEAKVIILNRDPEKWYESCESIYKIEGSSNVFATLARMYCGIFDPLTRNLRRYYRCRIDLSMSFRNHPNDKDKAIAWFNAQYKEFRDRIPPERRIEYTIQEGWKPLCEHLDVPIPKVWDERTGKLVEAPFPHVNDRAFFAADFRRDRKQSISRANSNLWTFVGKLAVAGALVYGIYLTWVKHHERRFYSDS